MNNMLEYEEETTENAETNPRIEVVEENTCPRCESTDVAVFEPALKTKHCWDCGAVIPPPVKDGEPC